MFIVTPGGIGTLLELFYTWQLMQVGHICRTPIILWGTQYKALQDYINNEIVERGFMNAHDAELAIQADTIEQTMELVHMAHSAYEQSGENACVNIHQYIAGAKRLGLA
jgi:predicted Rossmann-fold nucleotide-binding protein